MLVTLLPVGEKIRHVTRRKRVSDGIACNAVQVHVHQYSGTYKSTGKSMCAGFAHLYVLKDGKIQSIKHYVGNFVVSKALVFPVMES